MRAPGKRHDHSHASTAEGAKGSPVARRVGVAALSALAAVTLVIPAVAGGAGRALTLDGSTSVYPLMIQLAKAWHKAAHEPEPHVGQGSSDVGISDVAAGRVDIGDASRNPIEGVDPKGLVFTKIARDGVCVITSPQNKLANVSREEIQKIYTGEVANWEEVPGATVTGPIQLFDRISSSGTQAAFQDIFLGEETKISGKAEAKESNGLVQSTVAHNPQAIGFVSFKFTEGVNPVGFNGVACNLRNAKAGTYEGVRNFWMVTKGKPKGAALKFISWIVSPHNAKAHQIIATDWIPLNAG